MKVNNSDKQERRITQNAFESEKTTTNTNDSKTSSDNVSQDDNNSEKTDNSTKISGYALRFNQPSRNLGEFYEVIAPNALDNCDLSNVFLLVDHDFSKPLASVAAQTLVLEVDDKGLHFDATLNNTTTASDTIKDIKSGNLPDMSFGMVVGEDEFSIDDEGNTVRTITSIKQLTDIDVCALGAYSSNGDLIKVDERSFDKWQKEQQQEKQEKINKEKEKSMAEKTIFKGKKMNQNEIESNAFEKYLRSAGEARDLQGLTTDSAGKVVVPKEISTPILQLTQDKPTLANYITRRQVSNASGTLPVATRQNGILQTKKELAEVPDIDAQILQGVDYKLATRIGKIYISEEEMDDSVVDLTSTIKDQLQQLITNTDNANIISVLTKTGNFQTATASLSANLDDIKKIKNTMLDPQLSVQVVISSTDFNTLDTMKDEKGDYVLQPSVTSPTGKSLLGCDLIQVSDNLLNAGKMFIGSLAESVLEAYKGEITAQWQQFDYYVQGFLAGIRSDYQPIAKESGVLVNLGAGKANTEAQSH